MIDEQEMVMRTLQYIGKEYLHDDVRRALLAFARVTALTTEAKHDPMRVAEQLVAAGLGREVWLDFAAAVAVAYVDAANAKGAERHCRVCARRAPRAEGWVYFGTEGVWCSVACRDAEMRDREVNRG